MTEQPLTRVNRQCSLTFADPHSEAQFSRSRKCGIATRVWRQPRHRSGQHAARSPWRQPGPFLALVTPLIHPARRRVARKRRAFSSCRGKPISGRATHRETPRSHPPPVIHERRRAGRLPVDAIASPGIGVVARARTQSSQMADSIFRRAVIGINPSHLSGGNGYLGILLLIRFHC